MVISFQLIHAQTSRKEDTKAFIATQGPKEESKGHFWRMVWANNVSVVIMLCNFKENGKVSYLPNETHSNVIHE